MGTQANAPPMNPRIPLLRPNPPRPLVSKRERERERKKVRSIAPYAIGNPTASHAFLSFDLLFNARPVDVTRRSSKVAGRRIGNGQLTNAQRRTGGGMQGTGQRDSQKVIKTARKFAIHFMFAQTGAQDAVQNVIHPTKAFAITQQFHEQRGAGQDCHAGNEFCLGDKVIECGKEESK